MKRYAYVGPEAIRARERDTPPGTVIRDADALLDLCRQYGPSDDELILTYVVTPDGALRVAPRRSEHVACAGGQDVLAAGELTVHVDGERVAVTALSNQSTGYCPDIACWPAIAAALDAASVPRPDAFTFACVFRRCPACGERNLVKDDWFVCALCDAPLPRAWNFAGPA